MLGRLSKVAYAKAQLNSFTGKANHYGIHVVQNKEVFRVAGKLSKQLTLYDQKTTDKYVVDYKVLTV